MTHYLTTTASTGETIHVSVGAVIERNGKYLLIDRVHPPFGFAGLAGHVDEGETPDEAIVREIGEESGLSVINKKLLFEEEILWNRCGTEHAHYWYLYRCETSGDVHQEVSEEKSIGWYTTEELSSMNLEPVWKYWFEKLGIIK